MNQSKPVVEAPTMSLKVGDVGWLRAWPVVVVKFENGIYTLAFLNITGESPKITAKAFVAFHFEDAVGYRRPSKKWDPYFPEAMREAKAMVIGREGQWGSEIGRKEDPKVVRSEAAKETPGYNVRVSRRRPQEEGATEEPAPKRGKYEAQTALTRMSSEQKEGEKSNGGEATSFWTRITSSIKSIFGY